MRWGVCEALDTIATIQRHLGESADAARLAGATSAMRSAIGWSRSIREQQAHDDLLGAIDDGASLHAEGETMGSDAALAYATRSRGVRSRPDFGWDSLTPAEQSVVDLAVRGLKTNEIANLLFVSVTTVKTHLSHIYRKLGVRTRTQLASLHHARGPR